MKSLRSCCVAGLLMLGLVGGDVSAQTIQFVVIFKNHHYTQSDASTVSEKTPNPWEFRALIDGTSMTSTNPISSASVVPASGSTSPTVNLSFSGSPENSWEWSQLFANQSGSMSLNETFASGNYTFNVGAQNVTLNLSGDLYPNTPLITASVGTWMGGNLQYNPAQSLTLTINTFSTNYNMTSSRIGIDVSGPGYSNDVETFVADSTFTTIPANAFTVGQTYEVHVEFNRFSASTTVPVLGGQAVATFSTIVTFNIVAIPEPSTYAAVFGALALTGVVIHRRRRLQRS